MKIDVSIHQVLTGHAEAVYCLENPGGGELYSGGGDGFIGVWDMATGTFREPLAKMSSTIYSILKHPEHPIVYCGLQDGTLFILDREKRTVERSLKLSDQGLFDIVYLENGGFIVAADGEGCLHIIRGEDHEPVQMLPLADKAVRSLQVSPCGRFLIAGASDNQLYFLETGADASSLLVLRQVIPAHDNSVFTAVYKEGYALLTGGRDAMLRQWLWDKEQAAWQADREIPAHNYTINRIAIHPSGDFFATGSRDRTVKIWGAAGLELLKVINRDKYPESHTHSINTLMWLDERTLLTTGDDKRIIRWNVSFSEV